MRLRRFGHVRRLGDAPRAPVRVRVLAAALAGALVGAAVMVAVSVGGQGQGASSPLEARVSQLEARMTGAATLFTSHDRRIGALESHEHGAGPFETITLSGTGEARIHLLDDMPAGRYRATLSVHEALSARGSIRTADGFGTSTFVSISHSAPTLFSAVEGPRDLLSQNEIGVHDEIHVRITARAGYPWSLIIERIGDLPTAP